LYGRPAALQRLRHWQFGGEMVHSCDYQQASFRPAPLGFEAGTPPIAGVLGLGASLSYLSGLDTSAVARHEAALHRQLLDGLKARSGIQLLGSPAVALACFSVDGVHHSDLAQLLSEQGIAVRAGQHCAMPLLASLGVSGAVRVSLGLYNDGSDLVRFFRALDQALELLQ
jgi:cysteine sulfinate desulfinase